MATKKSSKSGKAASTGSSSASREHKGGKTSARKNTAGAKKASTGAANSKAGSPQKAGGGQKKGSGGAAAIAEDILADESASKRVSEYGSQLLDERSTTATQAARVVSELVDRKPELVVPLVDKFVAGLHSKHKRVVQASADALPAIARIAPARVARHLDKLKAAFAETSDAGKDGLVRAFSALCIASVAYQKRLEPVLTEALQYGQGKTLYRWTEIVLPALKGEPHARARSVVEDRLYEIPRSVAQQIADFLGIKLRPSTR